MDFKNLLTIHMRAKANLATTKEYNGSHIHPTIERGDPTESYTGPKETTFQGESVVSFQPYEGQEYLIYSKRHHDGENPTKTYQETYSFDMTTMTYKKYKIDKHGDPIGSIGTDSEKSLDAEGAFIFVDSDGDGHKDELKIA